MRRLLEAALWGLGANILLLAAFEIASRLFDLSLVTPDIGLLVFAVLAVRAIAQENLYSTAILLDRRLDLKNRLASAIDFMGRGRVDDHFRQAQLAETLGALAGRQGPPEPRIPRHLWAAPVLLALYVAFSFTYPFGPPPAVQEGGRTSGTARRSDDASLPREPARSLSRGGEPGRENAGNLPEPPRGEAPPAPAGDAVASKAAVPEARRDTAKEEPARTAKKPQDDSHAGVATGVIPEPAQLFSETVSKTLTPVGPARGRPELDGGPPEELPQPRGGVTFNLLSVPGRTVGQAGVGKGDAGGAPRSLEVTVDFDLVPAELRDCVRRYFKSLQEATKPG